VSYGVVAISPTDGSRGEELGSVVARELGFQLVNEQIVERVARQAGVNPEVIADVERRKSLVGRVLDRLGDGGPAAAASLSGFTVVTEDPSPGPEALRGLIHSVIWETAERGDAVIVAHAASLALDTRSDVLRVLITASPQTRARRLAEARDIGETEAEQQIARGDANRADYLKRFYGVSKELPTHYDMVLNTDRVAAEDAATLILGAARSKRVSA
jgi:cytidylate kinase-like protein